MAPQMTSLTTTPPPSRAKQPCCWRRTRQNSRQPLPRPLRAERRTNAPWYQQTCWDEGKSILRKLLYPVLQHKVNIIHVYNSAWEIFLFFFVTRIATPQRIQWRPINLQQRPQSFDPQPQWQNPWLPTQSGTPQTQLQHVSSPGWGPSLNAPSTILLLIIIQCLYLLF